MKKLQFVKSKSKKWNRVSFGDLKEEKKNIFTDIVGLDAKEQEGILKPELAVRRALRKREMEEALLKEDVF